MDIVPIDPNDDEQYLQALGAYSDGAYTAMTNLFMLLKLRAGTGKGESSLQLRIRLLALKDTLLFHLREVAPEIEARLQADEGEREQLDHVGAEPPRGSIVDFNSYRLWRSLGQKTLENPQAKKGPAPLAYIGWGRGGDAG